MKKCVLILFFHGLYTLPIRAQSHEIQQLLLDVTKLKELKNILNDLKEGYQIISGGYQNIKNISQGTFNLHQIFLNSLLKISPIVMHYQRIKEIINQQFYMAEECKKIEKQIVSSHQFLPQEINYLQGVYSNLLLQSLKNLESLAMVLTENKLRMNDEERLHLIDGIFKDQEDISVFFIHFNNEARVLALQRAGDEHEVKVLQNLFLPYH